MHVSLNLQYGAAYPPNQYGVPAGGPYPGTPTSNGQVYNKNLTSKIFNLCSVTLNYVTGIIMVLSLIFLVLKS